MIRRIIAIIIMGGVAMVTAMVMDGDSAGYGWTEMVMVMAMDAQL